MPIKVACVQVNPRDDMAANIEAAAGYARRAADAGATLISFPEYVSLMDGRSAVMRSGAFDEDQHPALAAFRDLAREVAATIHVGSLSVLTPSGKPTNRSFLIAPGGEIIARYDKIHMFDITLPDGREAFESRVYQAGNVAVVARSSIGLLGMSICYDVRFPQMIQTLADAGAEIILVPASFLPQTGNDHWHVLMRARAIDTGAYLVGAALCGEHGGKRVSFGHSLIVDPWGRVLADGGTEPGFITADLDLDLVREVRAKNPWHRPPPDFAAPVLDPENLS